MNQGDYFFVEEVSCWRSVDGTVGAGVADANGLNSTGTEGKN
jgi:hypothetical protein